MVNRIKVIFMLSRPPYNEEERGSIPFQIQAHGRADFLILPLPFGSRQCMNSPHNPKFPPFLCFLCSSVLPESGVNLCCALSTARELLIRSTLKLQQSMTLIQKRAQGIEGFRWGTLQKGRKIAKCCRNVDLQSARFAAVQQVCGGYTQLDGTLNPYGYW
jgi:hypothetical protein